MDRFESREEAGRTIARQLAVLAGRRDTQTLALSRGGARVAAEVARMIGAPLDLLLARPLPVPGREEVAMGAVAAGAIGVVDEDAVDELALPRKVVEAIIARELRTLEHDERCCRVARRPVALRGKICILIDDGLTQAWTMLAAVEAARRRGAPAIVLAVPVASLETVEALRPAADELVCLLTTVPFRGVGLWYDEFPRTSVAEVRAMLARLVPSKRPRVERDTLSR